MVHDIKLKIAFVQKYTFSHLNVGMKLLGKVLLKMSSGLVQIISQQDSQKFQMFILFSCCQIGGLRRSTNMAALY